MGRLIITASSSAETQAAAGNRQVSGADLNAAHEAAQGSGAGDGAAGVGPPAGDEVEGDGRAGLPGTDPGRTGRG